MEGKKGKGNYHRSTSCHWLPLPGLSTSSPCLSTRLAFVCSMRPLLKGKRECFFISRKGKYKERAVSQFSPFCIRGVHKSSFCSLFVVSGFFMSLFHLRSFAFSGDKKEILIHVFHFFLFLFACSNLIFHFFLLFGRYEEKEECSMVKKERF